MSYPLRTTIVHPPQQIHTLPTRSDTLLGLLQYTRHNKYTPFQIDQLPSQDCYSTPATTNTHPSKQISYPLRTTIVHPPQQIHALPNRSVTLLGLLQYTRHNKYTPFQIDQLPSQDYYSTPATTNTRPSKQISYPLRTTIVHPPQQIHALPNRSVTLLGLLQYTRHNKYTPFQIDQLPSQDYYSTPTTTNTRPSKQISYPLRTTIVHPPQQIHTLPNRSVTLLGLLQYTRHNKYTPFQIDQLPSQDYYSTPATTKTHPSKQISYPLRTTIVHPPQQIHTLPNRSVTLLGLLQYTRHNKYTPFQIDQLPSQDYYSTPTTTNTRPSKQISYPLRTTIVHPPQQIHALPNRSVTLLGLLQYTRHNKYTPFQIDQLPSQDYYSTPTTTNTHPSKQISYPLRTTIVHPPQQIHTLPNRSVTLLGLLQYTHHNKYTPFQIDQLPSQDYYSTPRHNKYTPFQIDQLPSQDYYSTPATTNTRPSKQISYPLRTTIVHPPQQIHTLPNRSVTLLGLLQYTHHNKYTPFQIDQLPSQDYYSTPATTNTRPSKQISYPLRTTIVHPPQQIHTLPNRSVTLLGLLQYTRHNKYTPFQIDQLPSQDYYSTPTTTKTHPSKQISYPLRTTIVHPPQQIHPLSPSKQISYPLRTTIVHPPQQKHTLPNRSVTLLGLLQYTRHNKYTPFQIDQLPSQDYYSTPATTNTRPSKQISYPLRTTIVHPPQQIHALPNRSVTLLGLLQYTHHNKYTPFQIDQLPSQDYYSTPTTTNTRPSKQISYSLRTTIVHPPHQIHTLPNRSVTLFGLLQYTHHNKYTTFQIGQLLSQDYYSTPATTNTHPIKQISYPLRTPLQSSISLITGRILFIFCPNCIAMNCS